MTADLSFLQDCIKRDPQGYKQEFLQQHKHFLTQYEIFQLKPSKDHKTFSNLVKFLSAVAPCYPEHLSEFPTQISMLLEQNALILQPDLRKILVKALILLRNRNLLSPTSLLSLFFKLFRCSDKGLRLLLRNHIISDISRQNAHKKSVELNRTLQNFMYTMLQEDNTSAAPRESLAVLVELFRKRVWNDKKTVNVISLGIFSQDSKMIGITLGFFLKPQKISVDGEEEEEEKIPTRRDIKLKYGKKMSRQTRSKKRKLDKKLKELDKKREQKLREEVDDTKQYNHEALLLINDPQGYAEKVFGALKRSNHSFEVKIGMMNLISRLTSANKLMIHNFYSFMQKYTQPHQQHITQLLAILVQSIHSLVSPEVVEPLLIHIANTFVTDRRPNEVIAIGLNTIREICVRSPLVMTAPLLTDLIAYKTSRDKGVMMASRSIISLFRAINPSLLPRKERGKNTDINIKPKQFGEVTVQNTIEGTEYLDRLDVDEDGSGEWETVSEEGESDSEGENKGSNDEGDSYDDEITTAEKTSEEKTENIETDVEDPENSENIPENIEADAEDVDEGEDEVVEEATEEPIASKPRLENIKILSEEDWVKIRYIQDHKLELQAKGIIPNTKKRKIGEVEYNDHVDADTIAGYQKKKKLSKEERVKLLKESQSDKMKYVFGMKRMGASSTNTEKKKFKAYSMVRHKALQKQRRDTKLRRKIKEKHIQKLKSQKLDHH